MHQGRSLHRLRACRRPLWAVVKEREGEEDIVKESGYVDIMHAGN